MNWNMFQFSWTHTLLFWYSLWQSVTFDCLMIVILSVPSIRHRPYLLSLFSMFYNYCLYYCVLCVCLFSLSPHVFSMFFCVVLFFLSAAFCLFICLSCSCMGHVAWIKLIELKWNEFFDRLPRTTTVSSFKSFQSVVFVLTYPPPHTHTHRHVTKWSLYPRLRTTSSPRIVN